ncbi:MAG: histidinol-phosphatase [Gemmatimonadaceae bacterium]|nr:histidinol-phosphatase [Gemmatimonadaceae bacterium]
MTSPLLQAVHTLATLAGDTANAFFRQRIEIEVKGDGSPVTNADRAAETAAREWIRAHFPGDGILGEEFGLEGADAPRRWVLDPIDGTKSFIAGVPLWGTLVAVVEGETVLAGAVYAPPTREIVVAATSEGAWFNGARTQVSTTADLSSAVLLTTDERYRDRPRRKARWNDLASRARVVRTWGDCYGYLLLATGRADVMVDDLMNPWDAAAVQVVVEEAGGVFTDFRGRPTAFGGDSIATNAALDTAVRDILCPGGDPGLDD